MSTSSSPAARDPQEAVVRPFPYADAAPENPGERTSAGASESEILQREQAARLAGQQEAEARANALLASQIDGLRETLQAALADFASERNRYFQQVEHEVVQLALSIARKILHREAQIDPLLLAGMVRVALDKIEGGTAVTLKVHPERAAEWRAYFHGKRPANEVPEVMEDPALDQDRCQVQTAMGTTELGVEIQLKEIEQGLFDLIAQRPGSGP